MKKLLLILLSISLIWTGLPQSIALSSTAEPVWSKSMQSISESLKSVTYGNGVYVAVGENGMIATSKDGVAWEWKDSGTWQELTEVVWNGKIFVAVGRAGVVVTSTDGQKWVKRDSTTNDDFECIAWNGSFFLAVSFYPYKSVDGITWESTDIDLNSFQILPSYATSLIWDGKQFLLFGNGQSSVIASKDGAKWELKCKTINGTLYDAAWNGKTYVAVGSYGKFATSSNGTAWTERNLEDIKTLNVSELGNDRVTLNRIIWNGKEFIAAGYSGSYYDKKSVILSSPDGINWKNMPVDASDYLYGLYYDARGAIAVGSYGCILRYDAQSGWQSVASYNPLNLKSVAYDGKKYIAVTGEGKILKSDTGVRWTEINLWPDTDQNQTADSFRSVAWNGKAFVVVGLKGMTLMSQDGENWAISKIEEGYYKPSLQNVIWDGNRFVAVVGHYEVSQYGIVCEAEGVTGAIYSSVDGTNWTKASVSSEKGLIAVASNSSIRVAVGAGGTIFTSGDGVEWVQRKSPTTKNLFNVSFDGKGFIATGSNAVLYSRNGIDWEDRTTGVNGVLNSIIWDGKRFVGIVGNPNDSSDAASRNARIAFSNNGINWKTEKLPDAMKPIDPIIWDGKKYVASYVNSDARSFLATSADGLKWDTRIDLGLYNYVNEIVWNGKLYVAVGTEGLVYTSPDGIKWTKRKSGTELDLYGITWNGTRFYAAGSRYAQQVIITSKDGITWTKGNPDIKDASGFANQILWNGKQFLILRDGYSSVSKDGSKWTFKYSGLTALNKAIWNGSAYVAVAGSNGCPGRIVTSTDGLNWTIKVNKEIKSLNNDALYDIAWSGKDYVALSHESVFLSKDGQNWSECFLTDLKTFTCIASNGRTYVGVGPGGLLATSKDGINWSPVVTNTAKNLLHVAWYGDKYIAVGDGGLVFMGSGQ